MKGRWAGWIGRVVALALFAMASAAGIAHAAIFDDGNDRKLLFDLRLKPEDRLTDHERMILRAADSYGNVGFCGKSGGNATLIDYFGRPAVITSKHMFFDEENDNKPKCTDAELRNAGYMPNVSYYDERGNYPRSFTHRHIKLVMPAIDMTTRFRLANDDWIIFYLEEDITADVMPGGHLRGAMRFPAIGQIKAPNKLTMIGIAPDIRNGLAVLYQTCDSHEYPILGIFHTCDTISGSSGSALVVRNGDELRLQGIHSGDIQGGAVMPPTDDSSEWNRGTQLWDPTVPDPDPGTYRAKLAEAFRNPALIPYQLQFLLHRAGCYAGKLDNKWGPGSRKALAAFVSSTGAKLPGRDPSMELWDALEDAAKQYGEACR